MSTKNKNKNKNKNATVAPKKQATAEKKSVKAKQAVVRASAPLLSTKKIAITVKHYRQHKEQHKVNH